MPYDIDSATVSETDENALRKSVRDSDRGQATKCKFRGVFLTALVVFSVVGATVSFSGAVAAAANTSVTHAVEYPDNTGDSTVELALDNTVSNGLDGNSELELYVDGNEVSSSVSYPQVLFPLLTD
jgi:surface glycoprotein (TIGR04207 family)